MLDLRLGARRGAEPGPTEVVGTAFARRREEELGVSIEAAGGLKISPIACYIFYLYQLNLAKAQLSVLCLWQRLYVYYRIPPKYL